MPEDVWPELKARAVCDQAVSPALARPLRDDIVATCGRVCRRRSRAPLGPSPGQQGLDLIVWIGGCCLFRGATFGQLSADFAALVSNFGVAYRPRYEGFGDQPMIKLIKALFMTLVVFGLAPTAMAKDWSLVRFSYSSGWDALPAIVAQERGFFAEQGLVVSGMPVSVAKAVAVSLGVGTTDLAAIPQETLLTILGAKVPVTVVSMGGCCVPMELVVPVSDTQTTSLTNLKGKAIGISEASPAYPVLIRLLNRARMRPSDVQIKFLPAARLTQAFKQKFADAVFDTQHFTATLTETKQGRVVTAAETVAKELGNIDAMPLVVRTELIAKEPDVVQKFVNAWIRAQVYIRQDPVDAAKLLQIFFHRQGITVADGLALSWVKMIKYDHYVWGKAEIADAEYNSWAIKTGGLAKTEVKLTGAVNNTFSERAFSQLEKESGANAGKAKP